jgi:hypothetical protein
LTNINNSLILVLSVSWPDKAIGPCGIKSRKPVKQVFAACAAAVFVMSFPAFAAVSEGAKGRGISGHPLGAFVSGNMESAATWKARQHGKRGNMESDEKTAGP